MQEEFPVTSGVGTVAGAIVGGGGVAGAAGKATGAGRALALQPGQRGLNVLRLAGGGAAAGGVTGAIESELDPTATREAATTGAIAGPVGAGALRGVSDVAGAVGRRLAPDQAAMARLGQIAQRFGLTPAQLQQQFTDFQQRFGRAPALAELLPERAAREVGEAIGVSRPATELIGEAAEEVVRSYIIDGGLFPDMEETVPAEV